MRRRGKAHNSTAQILIIVFLYIVIVIVLALFLGFCKLIGFHSLPLQSIGFPSPITVAVDCYCFVQVASQSRWAAKPLKPATVVHGRYGYAARICYVD